MQIEKNKVSVIRAKLKDDYVYDAIKNCGFDIHIPYKDKNIILRIMREIWFRLNLPGRRMWYNKSEFKKDADIYLLYDPLLVSDYFEWIKENNPNARIILSYENRADSTINPASVGTFVEKWSYDKDDCKQYSMKYLHPNYFEEYAFDSSKYEKKWDVLYLGRDKGRLEQILEYEHLFKKQGLRTYFHICADRSYMKYKNRMYKSVISYKEYLELLKNSKAILNIVREGQTSITQREMEAAFDGVKCITTNKAVMEFELYDPSRYFILGVNEIEDLNSFLDEPFKKISSDQLSFFKYRTTVINLLEGKEK